MLVTTRNRKPQQSGFKNGNVSISYSKKHADWVGPGLVNWLIQQLSDIIGTDISPLLPLCYPLGNGLSLREAPRETAAPDPGNM